VRAFQELPAYGKITVWEESGEGGRHGHKGCFSPTGNTYWPLQRTMETSLPAMRKSQRLLLLQSILQIRMPHGKKGLSRTKTNLYGNTSQKERTLEVSRKSTLRRYSIKLTEDQGKSSTSPLQKRSSSNLFRNIALAD